MAITRLTDLVTVFENKWVYGDVKFGYDGDVNQDHDTKYPLMLIEPPTSIMPVIYEGREEYEFEINFYNDKLVQIKLTFTMSGFTKCFRPTSNFPTDYSDLVGWLSADSLATFDIPNKKVSALGDRSGHTVSANVFQSTKTKQPLRIGYDGINDKTYLNFNGTTDVLTSESALQISGDSFTIFEVSKFGVKPETIFSYAHGGSSGTIEMFYKEDDASYTVLNSYGGQEIEINLGMTSPYTIQDSPHIGVARRTGGDSTDALMASYYDANNQKTYTSTASGVAATFNSAVFHIGARTGNTQYLSGEFNELIIYNRALTDVEVNDIVGYLNYKYKIY